jgi:hypothetical protein
MSHTVGEEDVVVRFQRRNGGVLHCDLNVEARSVHGRARSQGEAGILELWDFP